MKKLNSKDWLLLSRIARRLRGLKERSMSLEQRNDLQNEIDALIKVFVHFGQIFELHPLTVDTINLEYITGETKMANLKKPLMTAIVKATLRLSKMEKSSHNPYMKKEIQDEIANLILVMTQLPDFANFLIDKLQTEEQIRADERMKTSFEKIMTPKTGPLGNPIEEKLKKIGETILGKGDDESNE